MNHRKVIIGLIAASLIGSAGVAAQTVDGTAESAFTALGPLTGGDAQDEVVEGHTVYKKIVNQKGSEQAAVVVNVVNQTRGQVLWFDDSFLHQTQRSAACGGSVWATHSQGVLLPNRGTLYSEDKTYEIETPQRNTDGTEDWLITEFEGPDRSTLTRAWAVEVACSGDGDAFVATGGGDGFHTYVDPNSGCDDTSDDGDPATDAHCPSDVATEDPGPAGGVDGIGLEYNAVLWFEFGGGHLGPFQGGFAQANFGQGGTDSETHDTTEGNSHPYNPVEDEPAANHNHSTARISLYYLDQDEVPHGTVDFHNDEAFDTFHPHP